MSNFRQQKVEIRDQEGLVEALKDLGHKPEVSNTKQKVRGHGYENKVAEIILKKEDLKQGGDIGFNKLADGSFEVVTDTYVMRNFDLNKFARDVKIQYAKTFTARTLRNEGFVLETTEDESGTVRQRYVRA